MFWKRYYYTSRRCKRNGRIDGKKGIPPIEQKDNSLFEKELIAVAEEHLSYEAALREKRDGKLKARYCKAKLQKERYKEEISHIEALLDDKRKKLKMHWGNLI